MREAISAEKGERTGTRVSYRSGYYRRSLVTREGPLELRVPQDRAGQFSTALFERISARRRPWSGLCQSEMYVQGVSTRKVESDHRGAVRSRVHRLSNQPDQQDAGCEPEGIL